MNNNSNNVDYTAFIWYTWVQNDILSASNLRDVIIYRMITAWSTKLKYFIPFSEKKGQDV